jgi:hypothetical protein
MAELAGLRRTSGHTDHEMALARPENSAIS